MTAEWEEQEILHLRGVHALFQDGSQKYLKFIAFAVFFACTVCLFLSGWIFFNIIGIIIDRKYSQNKKSAFLLRITWEDWYLIILMLQVCF